MQTAHEKAKHFMEHETQFHLGALPTEQAHPRTRGLAETLQDDTAAGVRMILDVDNDILPVAQRVLCGPDLAKLVDAIVRAAESGRKIFFTGCGATGRLSILLEACWRRFWRGMSEHGGDLALLADRFGDRVFSVMAGGDHALIRSVEGYEDFTDFGKHQLTEQGVGEGDVVVAITEGGETSFVIGTAWRGLEAGAEVFFVYNNPSDVLCRCVERSREVIEEPRITTLDLASGPMAVAGSTRMQATTSELLVVGAAVETALTTLLRSHLSDADLELLGAPIAPPSHYHEGFARLIEQLRQPGAVEAIAGMIEFEEEIYEAGGLVTYLAHDYLLDILTDTTERNPTFMLPPFRKVDDTLSPPSWAFVKNPLYETPDAWLQLLQRPLRGLSWTPETYRRMGAPEEYHHNPPPLSNDEILKFSIGNEDDPSRHESPQTAAIAVLVGAETAELMREGHTFRDRASLLMEPFGRSAVLSVGAKPPPDAGTDVVYHVPCELPESPLMLWPRLAIKLVLNTVSTATMGRMGRLVSNWMAHVETTNKKLIDRGTRLISELAGVDYRTACIALHETLETLAQSNDPSQERPSPVQATLRRIGAR